VPASPPVVGGAAVATVTRNTTRLGGSAPAVDAAAVAETTYPGLTPATRPPAVALADGADWPSALAASVLMSGPLRAPVLLSTQKALPAVSGSAFQDMAPTGAHAVGGARVIRIGPVAAPSGQPTRTITGADHFAIAAQIAHLAVSLNQAAAHAALIVNADAAPSWAMPAAGLAAESGAPILLVSATGVPAATAQALSAYGGRATLYLVGPTSVISAQQASALGRYGTVKRISGKDPASNAVAMAQFSDGSLGWNVTTPGHGVVFANPKRPLDAVAAAPLSDSGDYGPLLLLDPSGSVPAAVKGYLTSIQPAYTSDPRCGPVQGLYNRGWLIGDAQAIPMASQDELDALLAIVPANNCPAQAVVAAP
jgi:hypothetical protein